MQGIDGFFLSLVAQHHGNHKLQDHVGWQILRGEGLGANRNNTHSFDQIDQNMREKHYKAGSLSNDHDRTDDHICNHDEDHIDDYQQRQD